MSSDNYIYYLIVILLVSISMELIMAKESYLWFVETRFNTGRYVAEVLEDHWDMMVDHKWKSVAMLIVALTVYFYNFSYKIMKYLIGRIWDRTKRGISTLMWYLFLIGLTSIPMVVTAIEGATQNPAEERVVSHFAGYALISALIIGNIIPKIIPHLKEGKLAAALMGQGVWGFPSLAGLSGVNWRYLVQKVIDVASEEKGSYTKLIQNHIIPFSLLIFAFALPFT